MTESREGRFKCRDEEGQGSIIMIERRKVAVREKNNDLNWWGKNDIFAGFLTAVNWLLQSRWLVGVLRQDCKVSRTVLC